MYTPPRQIAPSVGKFSDANYHLKHQVNIINKIQYNTEHFYDIVEILLKFQGDPTTDLPRPTTNTHSHMLRSRFLYPKYDMPGPGIEPRTTVCQADVLSTTLMRLFGPGTAFGLSTARICNS